jgi:hypothetical protein
LGALFVFDVRNYTFSQELLLVHDWEVRGAVDATSDFSGNLYVSDEHGTILKFDMNGILKLSYSGSYISPIYSLDVSHTSKIFGFYRDNQAYFILDRFLNPVSESLLNNSIVGYATETAYSADNNIWIFDQSDLSLKKIDLLNDVLITVISMPFDFNNNGWDIQQIEEYQNRLYLYNSSKDIYVFDNLGNYIKELNIQPDCKFWFAGSSMIYKQGNGIFKIDLYSNQYQQIGILQDTTTILKVISANNFIYLVSKNKIRAYK